MPRVESIWRVLRLLEIEARQLGATCSLRGMLRVQAAPAESSFPEPVFISWTAFECFYYCCCLFPRDSSMSLLNERSLGFVLFYKCQANFSLALRMPILS